MRRWLREHPEVAVPEGEQGVGVVSPPWGPLGRTEQDYFEALCDQPGALSGVAGAGSGVLLGAVDPAYALCNVDANARSLAKMNPEMKIISIERAPIDRAYSAWRMAGDKRSFEDALRSCINDGPSWTKEGWLSQSYVEAGEYNRIIGAFTRQLPSCRRLIMGDPSAHVWLAEFLKIAPRGGPLPHEHRSNYPAGDTGPSQEAIALLHEAYGYPLPQPQRSGE